MTAVHMTEPPRLPVRKKVAAAERGWGGVSPMLTRLAAERATGVLFREHGTLHLAEGLVVHAESPCAPGLEALLTAHGTLAAEAWQQALGESAADAPVSHADHPVGDLGHHAGLRLVDAGRLALGAFELCRLTALYDAAYFVLAPSSTPGRFRYGTAHTPPGTVRPVPVAALERETLRRRDLLHRIWPDPATDEAPLTLTDLPAAPSLTRRQRTVLAQANGTRTASDIARALGHLAFHTLVDVRRLTAAGVLTPVRRPDTEPARPQPPGRHRQDGPWEPPPPSREPSPAAPGHPLPNTGQTPPGPGQPPPLPRRGEASPEPGREHPYRTAERVGTAGPAPGARTPAHTERPPSRPPSSEPPHPDPHITLLKRLRDALEAL
ncbi:hypothetical protein ABZT17_29700 [Streptomyces sp. NPDC005648]|uniref:hypothetical protein n=1 Tax=Streptomyces sp. NPDC005648 TaxID=3157044 RepID=UPI0033AD4BE7